MDCVCDKCTCGNDRINNAQIDYWLNLNYWMRQNQSKCSSKGLGNYCSFYGPLTSQRQREEAALWGRGPLGTPPSHRPIAAEKSYKCPDVELQPYLTRNPKSCNGLSGADVSEYAVMPGAWQKGYQGVQNLLDININTRMADN